MPGREEHDRGAEPSVKGRSCLGRHGTSRCCSDVSRWPAMRFLRGDRLELLFHGIRTGRFCASRHGLLASMPQLRISISFSTVGLPGVRLFSFSPPSLPIRMTRNSSGSTLKWMTHRSQFIFAEAGRVQYAWTSGIGWLCPSGTIGNDTGHLGFSDRLHAL